MPTPIQLLAKMLSEQSSNPYANINDPVIRPPVIPNQPYVGTPWGTPPTTVNPPGPVPGGAGGADPNDPSGGGRGGTAPGSGAYGAMTSAERNTLGNIAGAFGVLGVANPGFSALGWGLRGALANDKYGITGRRGEVGITEQDVRDAMDYGGAFAASAKESERQAQEAAKQSALESFSTPTDATVGGPTGGEVGAGWGSSTPSSGFGAGEEAGGQTGGGSAGGGAAGGGPGGGSPGGGPDGEGQGGEGRGGDTDWQGGVRVGTPEKPGKTVFGKVGKETAIFIPQIMEQMGMQGREREVIQALQTMLRMLQGNQNGIGEDDADESGEGVVMEDAHPAPVQPMNLKKEKANGRRRK